MKTLAFFFALVLPAFSQPMSLARIGGGGGNSPSTEKVIRTEYPMKNIPLESEKFKAVFALVSAQESAKKNRPSIIKILQTVGDGKFLATVNYGSSNCLILLPDKKYADDTLITENIEKTDQLHQYTSVTGAVKTIPIYRLSPVHAEDSFTEDQFRNSLMDGKTYEVSKPSAPILCQECNGFGKVPTVKGKRNADSKSPCLKCKGQGKINAIQQILVTW